MEASIGFLMNQLEAPSGRFGLVLAAFSLYLTWLTASTLRQYFRLRHIRGPRIAGFSKIWLARSVLGGRMHLDLIEAIEKYGPDVPFTRIGPDEVTTRDPAFMRNMLRVQSEYQKSDWYNAMRFNPERDNILSIQDNELHTRYRAKLAPGVRFSSPTQRHPERNTDICQVHRKRHRTPRAPHQPQHSRPGQPPQQRIHLQKSHLRLRPESPILHPRRHLRRLLRPTLWLHDLQFG